MQRLTKGSKGNDVVALQQLLNIAKVAQLTEDGDFGGKTEEAIKLFQYQVGLPSTGVLDDKTKKELYATTKINALGVDNFEYAGIMPDNYNPEYQKKDIIVLHHTAGGANPYYVRDHFNGLPQKVATCYIIGGEGEHDGKVLQIYKHPSQWASHLNIWDNFNVFGRGKYDSAGRNRTHEVSMAKRSVAVEVCNFGYLEYVDGGYWFMSRGKKIKEVPAHNVVDYGEEGYRGKRFYQKYTDKQIEATYDFIVKAAKFYGITIDKPKNGFDDRWFDYSWKATRGEQNLISHSSVRSKSDMHPQPELIKMLNDL